jgi:hypothetical protein
MNNIFIYIFLFFTFFSFTQIIPLNTYNQPWVFVIAIFVYIVNLKQIIKNFNSYDFNILLYLIFLGFFLFIFSIPAGITFQSIKWLLNYCIPFILIPIYYYIIINKNKILINTIKISYFLWIFVGLVQTFINNNFLTSLVGERQNSAVEYVVESGRGVLGFAPEPTHHGFQLLLFSTFFIFTKQKNIFIISSLIAALFIAKSSSVVFCIILALFLFLLKRFKIKYLFYFFIIFILLYFPIINYLYNNDSSSRIFVLLKLFAEDPFTILLSDYSVNMRLGGIIATIYAIFNNYFLPTGLSGNLWMIDINYYLNKFKWLYEISEEGWPSGFFILFYQAGFLIIPFYIYLYSFINKLKTYNSFKIIIIYSSFFIFIGQFFILNPLFSLLISFFIYNKNQKNDYY